MVKKGYGQVVTWNMRGLLVSRERLLLALLKAGIKVHIKETEPGTYLRRAIEQAVSEGAIRRIGESETHVGYAIVEERGDLATAHYEGHAIEAVVYNKLTKAVKFKTRGDLTRTIRQAMQDNEGGLVSSEVGQVLQRVLTDHCHAISLRDTGGCYFVPDAYSELLDKAEAAIKSVVNKGGKARLHRLGVITGVRESADLAALYDESARAEIKVLRDEAGERMQDLEKARPATFVRHAQRVREIIERVKVYERTLGKDFQSTIDYATKTVATLEKTAQLCLKARERARK